MVLLSKEHWECIEANRGSFFGLGFGSDYLLLPAISLGKNQKKSTPSCNFQKEYLSL
jgi:hypothetical protein